MPGQHIWHVKVRRTGQAEPEIAEPQLDRGRAPVQGEVIDVSVKRKSVRAKIVAFNTSTSGNHFRSTPISRHFQCPSACLKGASNGSQRPFNQSPLLGRATSAMPGDQLLR